MASRIEDSWPTPFEHGVTIPFPIRTLDLSRVGGITMAEELRDAKGEASPR